MEVMIVETVETKVETSLLGFLHLKRGVLLERKRVINDFDVELRCDGGIEVLDVIIDMLENNELTLR